MPPSSGTAGPISVWPTTARRVGGLRKTAEKAASMLPDDAQVVQSRQVLACACARLGDTTRAKDWYERARKWLDKTHCQDPVLCRLQDEAAGLLGIERGHFSTGAPDSSKENGQAAFNNRE